ncbi:MAG: DNA polymerase I [Saprospiraceae bacterium]
MSDKRLFLLDGHALVYRAHFSFITRPLINSKGVNTSAVMGFVRTLWDLMQNEHPTHLAVAFDPPTATFRHTMFEAYKANREEQPDDIRIAIPYIMEILHAFKIPILMVDHYEADDVIGTIAKKSEKAGCTVYMVTPDKDFGQLVSDKVFLYKPSRQGNGVEIWGEKEVKENWQIQRVDQVVDMLGLMGDSVDNIPGIPGIGEKTAAKLLAEFDTVENLVANLDKLKGKQKEQVEKFADQGLLSKKLALIDTDVPIDYDDLSFQIDPPDKERLAEIFKELEFRSLAKQILGEEEAPAPKPKTNANPQQGSLFDEAEVASVAAPAAHSVAEFNIHNTPHAYHLVDTPKQRAALIALLAQQSSFCFDSETTNIDPNLAELVGLSFSIKSHEAYYVPIPEDQTEARAVVHEFKAIFEDEKICKVGQNIKYDAIMLKWYGVEVRGAYFDTMIAHYLLEPELRHSMDYMAETYLKYQPVKIESLIGKRGKGQLTMREVDVELVKDYAAEDADITLQLQEFLEPQLKKDSLDKLYYDIEEPLIRVLTDLEFEGIKVDVAFLQDYAVELGKEILKLEDKIYEQVGEKFNIGSPKQVGEMLFDKLKAPGGKKTKTGQYSTNEEILADLVNYVPVAGDILKHRGLQKLLSTYVDGLPKMVNPRTGRIHSSFNQALAATGRLSSNNPNLQNIPIRTAEGARVREAFVARDENHLLMSADYSQIELRLIAEISGDEAMLEAFQSNQDIHRATAARVFNVEFDKVSTEQRYRAKTINFAIIYGGGATTLSRQLGIKRTEASGMVTQYFNQYPGLRSYMERTIEEARRNGYVTTLMGRRRYLRDINSKSQLERSNSERIAINTPIQGTAADMIKIAMVDIHKALKDGGFKTKMILQVHDELIFDTPKDEVEAIKPIVIEKMKNALPDLKVPIEVGVGVGKTWFEAH